MISHYVGLLGTFWTALFPSGIGIDSTREGAEKFGVFLTNENLCCTWIGKEEFGDEVSSY